MGDSYVNDVGGARNAGIVPMLYDPYGFHAGADCERLSSLHDLVAMMDPHAGAGSE